MSARKEELIIVLQRLNVLNAEVAKLSKSAGFWSANNFSLGCAAALMLYIFGPFVTVAIVATLVALMGESSMEALVLTVNFVIAIGGAGIAMTIAWRRKQIQYNKVLLRREEELECLMNEYPKLFAGGLVREIDDMRNRQLVTALVKELKASRDIKV